MIVSDVRKHPTTLDDATRAYAEATSSNVRFLIVENKKMTKELQMTKQGGETGYNIHPSRVEEVDTG